MSVVVVVAVVGALLGFAGYRALVFFCVPKWVAKGGAMPRPREGAQSFPALESRQIRGLREVVQSLMEGMDGCRVQVIYDTGEPMDVFRSDVKAIIRWILARAGVAYMPEPISLRAHSVVSMHRLRRIIQEMDPRTHFVFISDLGVGRGWGGWVQLLTMTKY